MEYEYVIVGAGMAADAAVRGIRRHDPKGRILVIGDEPYPPYQRPPLSKKLWLDMRMEQVWLDGWKRRGADLWLHTAVTRIEPQHRRLMTRTGSTVQYGELLLATGVRPRRWDDAPDAVYYVGDVATHVRLFQALAEPRQVIVVGGGFIGSEMAAVLSTRGHQVTWVLPQAYPFEGFFPPVLADHVAAAYQQHGVQLVVGSWVERVEENPGGGVRAHLKDGRDIRGDLVVAGLGSEFNDELAKAAGLATGPGIVVDTWLKTAADHVWAAGDVAVMAPHHEPMWHEDHALTQGRVAGENMAGAKKPYTHVPFFYSDLYDDGYEAIGRCETRYEVVEDWVVPGREGVVYYLDQGRVVGVLNWNVWDGIPKARDIMAEEHPWEARDLVGKIRNGAS
ncbi:MAG: FAD-dependent oxidoreductase [Firmicutes bacterium]|nr:FAD-dependent oxidoreductase [Bacillota bacterium]